MLRVASFKVSDAKGINKLLDEFRIAQGAQILVSNGEVIIPFEDGQLETPRQKIIALREQKNIILQEASIVKHAVRVMEIQTKEIQDAITEIGERINGITDNPSKKAPQAELEFLTKKLHNDQATLVQNREELKRLERNIRVITEQEADYQMQISNK